MTSLKAKLEALNTEALEYEQDIKHIKEDHPDMISKLDSIETFIKDSKETIEQEAQADTGVNEAYTNLKDTLSRLKNEITALKTAHAELKNKIARVAGMCIFGGTVLGIAGSLGLGFI